MKPRARIATPSVAPLLDGLTRALAAGGASELPASVPDEIWRRALVDPASDFLGRPGKELRRLLVHAGWILAGGAPDESDDRLALIVEVLHAGSLIIDDIQDGSLERRGRPALHVSFGVPVAINTGCWMYFWAQSELGELDLPPERELLARKAMTSALVRCHQGQALDLSVRVGNLDLADVHAVVAATTRLKTAALCRLAAEFGAIAASATATMQAGAGDFGEAIGTALQMLDDLGSLTSETRRAKGREDLQSGRPTWPWAWLAAQRPFGWPRCAAMARALAAPSSDSSVEELIALLTEEVGAIGRSEIRRTLAAARDNLLATFGDGAVTKRVLHDLAPMETSFG